MPAYMEALNTEVRLLAEEAGEKLPVQTVFFGGGTPSLVPPKQVGEILDTVGKLFDLDEAAEISLEANPGTLDAQKLRELRAAGVSRLSFGVQSASPEELRMLERQHDFQDVIQAVKWARQAGFDNLNLDWIFGLPGQSLASWKRNMQLAVSLSPEHLSLYALSIEHGTPFKELAGRGLLPDLDIDLAADMYEYASAALDAAGYQQYEISNWAKPDKEGCLLACKHNLQYWRNLPYAGLGAGAHGFIGGYRTANVLAPAAYIKRVKEGKPGAFPRTPATASLERIGKTREMSDTMMMGLRLVEEGVAWHEFHTRFDARLEEIYGEPIRRLTKLGLLESTNGSRNAIRLTEHGRLLGNQVFLEFV